MPRADQARPLPPHCAVLQRLRVDLRLTQEGVCEKVYEREGVLWDRSVLSAIENGKKALTPAMRTRLCSVYGVAVQRFEEMVNRQIRIDRDREVASATEPPYAVVALATTAPPQPAGDDPAVGAAPLPAPEPPLAPDPPAPDDCAGGIEGASRLPPAVQADADPRQGMARSASLEAGQCDPLSGPHACPPNPTVPQSLATFASLSFGLLYAELNVSYCGRLDAVVLWGAVLALCVSFLPAYLGFTRCFAASSSLSDPEGTRPMFAQLRRTAVLVTLGGCAGLVVAMATIWRTKPALLGASLGPIVKDSAIYSLLAGCVWNWWLRFAEFMSRDRRAHAFAAVSFLSVLVVSSTLLVMDAAHAEQCMSGSTAWPFGLDPRAHVYVRAILALAPTLAVFFWHLEEILVGHDAPIPEDRQTSAVSSRSAPSATGAS